MNYSIQVLTKHIEKVDRNIKRHFITEERRAELRALRLDLENGINTLQNEARWESLRDEETTRLEALQNEDPRRAVGR